MRTGLIVVLTAVVALSLFNVVPAQACTGGGGGGTWWINHGNGWFWRLDHRVPLVNELVDEIEIMDTCLLALNLIPGIQEVRAVMMFDSETGRPFEELVFRPSDEVAKLVADRAPVIGAGLESIPNVTEWAGFIGKVRGFIPEGKEVDIAFEVRIDPSYTPEELVYSYNQVGLVGMGALGDDGQINPNHFIVQRPLENGLVGLGTDE